MSMGGPAYQSPLAARLRLIVITDAGVAAPRSIEEVVEAALGGGAPAVQLRDKAASARELREQAQRLRGLTRQYGALFFVNDRVDVALDVEADGVHLGPDDLPVAGVRAATPPGFLIGYSTDRPGEARQAVLDGADYVGCGAVFATANKADAGTVIGLGGLRRVVEAVDVPVVGIGGITVDRAADVAGTGAAGVAVIGAVSAALDPEQATRALLQPFAASPTRGSERDRPV